MRNFANPWRIFALNDDAGTVFCDYPEGTKKLEGSGESTEPSRRIAPWKELLVAVAGPAMNLVLAAVLAVILSLMPSARFGQLAAKIGEVPEGGPAALGGMKPGDIVLAVGGNPVSNWYEMMTEIQIAGAAGDKQAALFGQCCFEQDWAAARLLCRDT